MRPCYCRIVSENIEKHIDIVLEIEKQSILKPWNKGDFKLASLAIQKHCM